MLALLIDENLNHRILRGLLRTIPHLDSQMLPHKSAVKFHAQKEPALLGGKPTGLFCPPNTRKDTSQKRLLGPVPNQTNGCRQERPFSEGRTPASPKDQGLAGARPSKCGSRPRFMLKKALIRHSLISMS